MDRERTPESRVLPRANALRDRVADAALEDRLALLLPLLLLAPAHFALTATLRAKVRVPPPHILEQAPSWLQLPTAQSMLSVAASQSQG